MARVLALLLPLVDETRLAAASLRSVVAAATAEAAAAAAET